MFKGHVRIFNLGGAGCKRLSISLSLSVLRTHKFRWDKAPFSSPPPPLALWSSDVCVFGQNRGIAGGGCGLDGSLARKEIKARASSCYVPLYNDYVYTYTTSKIVHKFKCEQTKTKWFQKTRFQMVDMVSVFLIQNYSETKLFCRC